MDKEEKEFYTDAAIRNGGRYQLAVAAWFIADRTKAEADSMRDRLFEAAGAGKLTVYERGMDEVYRFKSAPNLDKEVWLEAKWNGLNDWLKINEPGIFEAYQFPEPDAPAAKVEAVRLPVATQQNDAILNWLKANQHDPLKLPVPPSGKAGVKKLCRDALCESSKQLFSSVSVFDTAWDRLRANSKITDAKDS